MDQREGDTRNDTSAGFKRLLGVEISAALILLLILGKEGVALTLLDLSAYKSISYLTEGYFGFFIGLGVFVAIVVVPTALRAKRTITANWPVFVWIILTSALLWFDFAAISDFALEDSCLILKMPESCVGASDRTASMHKKAKYLLFGCRSTPYYHACCWDAFELVEKRPEVRQQIAKAEYCRLVDKICSSTNNGSACERRGSECAESTATNKQNPQAEKPPRFSISTFSGAMGETGSTVLDTQTRLQWRAEHVADKTYSQAVSYCKRPAAGHSDWRLPSVGELSELRRAPNDSIAPFSDFPEMPLGTFWANSEGASGGGFDFSFGGTYTGGKDNRLLVRCVRSYRD